MFVFDHINGKKVLKSTLLEGVDHCFTTRDFPLTPGALSELENDCENNRDELCRYFNIKRDYLISPIQTHTANVSLARVGQIYNETDALVTDSSKMAILLNFADCVPIILYDEKLNTGAVVHAGWRGTEKRIVVETINFMKKLFGTTQSDLIAAIGPAISKNRFEVDENVFLKLKQCVSGGDFWTKSEIPGKYNVDLKMINYIQLKETGVNRIDLCGYCTYDFNDIFFSYRKECGNTARHSAVLKLKEQKCQ